MGNASEPAHLESCLWDTSTLANSLHELEDCVHHLWRGDICAFSSSDDVLAPLAVRRHQLHW